MPDAVVGTVCVAPRARSANRRVYFLELQGDDDTRHHVLCKATMLGGLLPDEATVHTVRHAHAPRLSRTTHVHARTRHAHHTHIMQVPCTGGVAQGPAAGRHAGRPSGAARAVRRSRQIATAALFMPWRLLSCQSGALARERTGRSLSSTPPT